MKHVVESGYFDLLQITLLLLGGRPSTDQLGRDACPRLPKSDTAAGSG